jgi:two-component system sensor histidine kinase HydH
MVYGNQSAGRRFSLIRKITVKKGIPGLVEYTEKMIAALAHEIRNPLNSMKGAAEYLNEKYSGTPEIKDFSGIILSEINRVDNYLNEFLSFSRGVKIKLSRVNLKNFITGIIMTVKHSFPYEIKTDLEKADMEIELDNEQIRQVMVNLLSNAREAVNAAVPKNPMVKITAGVRGARVYISVADNGTGMKPVVLKNIFMPFFTTKEDGMGIGLSVCRAVVQRHGGRIFVKTTVGKGSVFTTEFPSGKRRKKNA